MSVTVPEIKDLVPLLESTMKDTKVLECERSFLTKPGDNYGSIMLKLKVKIQRKSSKIPETLDLVAKLPVINPILRNVFQPEISFVKENNFYREMYPAIIQFQKTRGVSDDQMFDVFAKCCGVRNSLNEDKVCYDDDAVLILENLISQGYEVGDRLKGFSRDTSMFILEKLAMFHAVPIAVRRCDTDLFNAKIKPQLTKIDVLRGATDAMNQMIQTVFNTIRKTINDNDELLNRILEVAKESSVHMRQACRDESNIFNSISHGDFWTNNMLIRNDPTTGKTTDVKIVDFQVASFDSLAKDVLFFVMTSVQFDVVEAEFLTLIKHYYYHFENQLKLCNCPLDGFTFETFMDEFKLSTKEEFFHILHMLWPLHTRDVPDMDKMDDNSFNTTDHLYPSYFTMYKKIIYFLCNNKLL